jgi:hypothetical protein
MICSSVNRPFFISESPFVASSYRADLKILNFIWSKLPRAGQENDGRSQCRQRGAKRVLERVTLFPLI